MDNHDQNTRHVVGVMTGTSIDGMDAALVRTDGRGLDTRATLVRHVSESLGDLQPRLRAAADQQPLTAGDFAQLAWDFGMLHAMVIERLVESSAPDLICVHGQTVFHQPPISWQLVNPAPVAARFKCPIVSDLRQADLAHGGQGAPITPIADWILFRDREGDKSRAVVNLGGFCNATILPRAPSPAATRNLRKAAAALDAISGFDVCACNQLLDALAREVLAAPFDMDGAAARRGRAMPQAAEALLKILDRQRRSSANHRSLGTGDEALAWLHEHRASVAPDDLAASAVQAIAQTILAGVTEQYQVDELILAGGGARNLAMRDALQKPMPGRTSARPSVIDTASFGIPVEAREAVCFAILGALSADGVAVTLPRVTGCNAGSGQAPLGGMWTNVASLRR